jgi:hypothetical protein
MVTGTTDNGGCRLSGHVREDGPATGRAQCIAAYAPPAAARWRVGDLRKTARGASSPAKPALHIPELSIVSACPSGMPRSCGPVAGLVRLVDVVGDANADSPSTTGMAGVGHRGV